MMWLFDRRSNIRSRQSGEDERLDECHNQLDQVHKCRKQHSHNSSSHCSSYTVSIVTKDEHQSDQAQDDDVSRRDVGKKTNHQRKRLDEDSHDLHDGQNRLDKSGDARHPKDVLPIVAVSVDGREDEGQECQCHGNGQVACDVGTTREKWHQPNQVQNQHKEKQRHDVRLEPLVVFFSDHWNGYFVPDEYEERLHEGLQSFGGHALAGLVSLGNAQENKDQDQRAEQHREDIAGDGEVVKRGHASSQQTTVQSAGCFQFVFFTLVFHKANFLLFLLAHDFYLLLAMRDVPYVHMTQRKALSWLDSLDPTVIEYISVGGGMAVVEHAGHSRGQPLIWCVQNDWQRQVKITKYVKFIGIADVVHGCRHGIVFVGSLLSMPMVAVIMPVAVIVPMIMTRMVVMVMVVPVLGQSIVREEDRCGKNREEEQPENTFRFRIHCRIF